MLKNRKISLDPVYYFSSAPHVVDLIFQHFMFQDLINLTCVSPDYNNLVSNSAKYLKKFNLIVNKSKKQPVQRDYQNLTVTSEVNLINAIDVVKRSSSWKFLN